MSHVPTLFARQLVREGLQRLRAAGMEHARYEAEWLLGRLVDTAPLELYLQDTHIPSPVAERFYSQIDARAAGIPLQYLLGEAEFFGRSFSVMPGVFIPRPETEGIVEHTLQALRAQETRVGRPLRLLDLGTGSGCIAITLAHELPTCVVVGVELSWKALHAAQQNVRRHQLSSRVHLVQGCWMEPVRGTFDGVLSNPPYVPSAQVDHLPLDVRQEPRVSLDGGTNGMRDLFQLMAQAPQAVSPGGILALECGEEQVPALLRRASQAPWVGAVRPLHDLASRLRGVLITKK